MNRGSNGIAHILNGDTMEAALVGSSVPGERLPFREALVTGPAPEKLSDEEWRDRRAAHLAQESRGDGRAIAAELLRQDEALARLTSSGELVLWFEPDLFCQVNLIHLLDRFGRVAPASSRISLVEPVEDAEDRPRSYALREPAELVALFEARRPVGEAEVALATEAWAAWRSPDPTAIERMLASDTTALPHLYDALLLHLARFPSTRNGLGQVENVALDRIVTGVEDFGELFREFGEAEPGYGLGDSQFLASLDRLAHGKEPLLLRDGGGEVAAPWRARFRATEAGRRVAASDLDQLELNGVDLWLGGAHLRDGAPGWRWDERREELVPEPERRNGDG